LDDKSYNALFVTNKELVIEAVKKLKELEASCDLIVDADPEHRDIWLPKMFKALLDFKTSKFELVEKAYFGDNPNPFEPQYD
jgi:hypothetical protein